MVRHLFINDGREVIGGGPDLLTNSVFNEHTCDVPLIRSQSAVFACLLKRARFVSCLSRKSFAISQSMNNFIMVFRTIEDFKKLLIGDDKKARFVYFQAFQALVDFMAYGAGCGRVDPAGGRQHCGNHNSGQCYTRQTATKAP